MEGSGSADRLSVLDALRAIAILLVLGRHNGAPEVACDGTATQCALELWHRGGWVGVDLFFVLSGFLVSGLLFKEFLRSARISPLRFFVRRCWKIYPPFYAFLFVSFAVALGMGQPIPAARFTSEVFFLQSYLDGIWPHTWSLAVEEHFYVLLPLLLIGLLALGKGRVDPFRPVVFIAGAFVLGCLLARVAVAPTPFDYMTHMFNSHLRFDSLFVGVAVSYAYHFARPRFDAFANRYARLLLLAGAVAFLPVFAFDIETSTGLSTIGFAVVAFGAAALLVGSLARAAAVPRPVRALAWIGKYSYSIYLWHIFVASVVSYVAALLVPELRREWLMLLNVAAAIVVGAAMSWAVERPALALRDRWFPSRSGRPVDGDRPVAQELAATDPEPRLVH